MHWDHTARLMHGNQPSDRTRNSHSHRYDEIGAAACFCTDADSPCVDASDRPHAAGTHNAVDGTGSSTTMDEAGLGWGNACVHRSGRLLECPRNTDGYLYSDDYGDLKRCDSHGNHISDRKLNGHSSDFTRAAR
jgi:hypothetical protein